MAGPDEPWVLVVAHPEDGDTGSEVEALLAERGLQPIVAPPSKRSTFEDDLKRARAVVMVAGAHGLDEWRLPAVEERLAADPAFRVVVAVAGRSKLTRIPPAIASASVVELTEPDGADQLAALLRETTTQPALRLSPSVTEARRRLLASGDDPTGAHLLALGIASLHPEYGGGSAKALLETPFTSQGERRSVDAWLEAVRGLVTERGAVVLHGRAVMLGLGLLDPQLRGLYRDIGFEEALVAEIREPLPELLTERGLALWEERDEPPPTPPPSAPEDTVPTHTDNPATVDALGREGIARVLARRIRDMRSREIAAAAAAGDEEHRYGRSFLVHLHAPWGMGKTSLLNFLQRELRKPDELGAEESRDSWSYGKWIVIDFNAWRYQRSDPPWWWLMNALYHQGLAQLKGTERWRFRAREWRWRLWVGWPRLAVALLVLVGIGLVVKAGWITDLWTGDGESPDLTGFVTAAAAIAAAVTTVWATLRTASRWLLTASPSGARQFVEQTRDPMETVKSRISALVEWLGYPVIVLVDDLDRCRGDYVVRLLEGVQTLFRDQPVAYVVAADRDWLSDAYDAAYGDFVSAADEPGRPLGYLFLEKTFQMSVTLPAPGRDMRDGYWGGLIRPGEPIDRKALEAERRKADLDFAGVSSQEAAQRKFDANPGTTPAEQTARREAVAIRLASTAAEKDAMHALLPFAGLIDPNPRAMKRLVNAYGIARGIETIGGESLAAGRDDQQRTALWTILTLRWPQLADHLARHPGDVAKIGAEEPPAGVPAGIAPLFADASVAQVVHGEGDGIEVSLDEEAIRRSAGLVAHRVARAAPVDQSP